MIYLIFALIGLLVGGVINILSDDLPARKRPEFPSNPINWLVTLRTLLGRDGDNERRTRDITTELSTAALFAVLPAIEPAMPELATVAFYCAVLILIIIIDLENRLILHVVTFPTTLIAIILSFLNLANPSWRSAALGALAGFLIFYIFYLVGQWTFGPGALGFGDVTLSMTMGAMLGLEYIIFALILGILIGGVVSLFLVLSRRFGMRSYIPYGEFLAVAGMIMLLWGEEIVHWYLS